MGDTEVPLTQLLALPTLKEGYAAKAKVLVY